MDWLKTGRRYWKPAAGIAGAAGAAAATYYGGPQMGQAVVTILQAFGLAAQ